jgi:uncharacterized protein (TIGR02246 family)
MIPMLFALLLLAAAPAGPNPVQQHIAEVRTAIDAGNAAYIATQQHGDAKAFAALYADNAASIGTDGSVTRGRAAIEAAAAASLASSTFLKGTITTTDLAVDGDTAYEEGTYLFSIKPKDRPAADYTGRYLTIWTRQQDGSWKIQTDTGFEARPCTGGAK